MDFAKNWTPAVRYHPLFNPIAPAAPNTSTPPQVAQQTAPMVPQLTGSSNVANKWGKVGRVLGKPKQIFPNRACQPYTEIINIFDGTVLYPGYQPTNRWQNYSFINLVYEIGPGPVFLTNYFFQNPNGPGVLPMTEANFPRHVMQVTSGFKNDPPITLYPLCCQQTNLSDVKLTQNVTQIYDVPSNDVEWIELDFAFPRGLYHRNSNTPPYGQAPGYVEVQLIARNKETNESIVLKSYTSNAGSQYSFRDSTGKMRVPKGNYEILVTRVNAETTDTDDQAPRTISEIQLIAIKGFKNKPAFQQFRKDRHGRIIPLSFIAMRILSTDNRDDGTEDRTVNGAVSNNNSPYYPVNSSTPAYGGHIFNAQYFQNAPNSSVFNPLVALNGTLPAFRCDAQSLLSYWNGANFASHPNNDLNMVLDGRALVSPAVIDASDNPSDCGLLVLTSGALNYNALDCNRIDGDSFKKAHEWCVANDFRCDGVVAEDISAFELLNQIGATARMQFVKNDDSHRVIIDRPRVLNTEVAQHFCSRNYKNFKVTKTFLTDGIPHAILAQFLDETTAYKGDGLQQGEVLICRDGYTPETVYKLLRQDFPYVTRESQVYKLARHMLETFQQRGTYYEFTTETDGYILNQGDLILVNSPVVWDVNNSGKILEVLTSGGYVTGFIVDEQLISSADYDSGTTYSIRVRCANNLGVTFENVSITPDSNRVDLASPVIWYDDDAHPNAGDLLMFGEDPVHECLVTNVAPDAEGNVQITCTDAAPGVHYVDGSIELPSTGQVGVLPRNTNPLATPTILSHSVHNLSITLEMQRPGYSQYVDKFQFSYKKSTDPDEQKYWQGNTIISKRLGVVYITVPEPGEYDVRVRTMRDTAYVSSWASVSGIVVESINRTFDIEVGVVGEFVDPRIFVTYDAKVGAEESATVLDLEDGAMQVAFDVPIRAATNTVEDLEDGNIYVSFDIIVGTGQAKKR